MHHLLTSLSRDNLCIFAGQQEAGATAPLWLALKYRDEYSEFVRSVDFSPNWMTDVDYDGFDWDDQEELFVWGGKACKNLEGFTQAVGIEQHAVRVHKERIFANDQLPAAPARIRPVILALNPGCSAVDAGARLPGVNDGFLGNAPDLGAHEYGQSPPIYGPRP